MSFLNALFSGILLARGVIDSELRSIRLQIMRMLVGVACLFVAVLLLIAAAGYFLWGIHQYFAAYLPPAVAAGAVSAVALVLALGFALFARSRMTA